MPITKVLHSTNPAELNNQLIAAMEQGLRPVGNVTVVDKGQGGVFGFYQTVSDTFPQDGASAYEVWLEAGNTGSVEDYFATIAGQRVKSEVVWSAVNVTIPTTPTNLIALLKVNAPVKGTLAPLFSTVDNMMHPVNQNTNLLFKLNLQGTWSGGGSTNRSMTLDFTNTTANRLNQNRTAGSGASDALSFPTFFTVDKDDALGTNGSEIFINATGDTFVATTILLIASHTVYNA